VRTNTNTRRNDEPEWNTSANSDGYSDSDGYSGSDGHGYSYGNRRWNIDTNTDACRYSFTYTAADANSDTDNRHIWHHLLLPEFRPSAKCDDDRDGYFVGHDNNRRLR
jgi:hypothetical protein